MTNSPIMLKFHFWAIEKGRASTEWVRDFQRWIRSPGVISLSNNFWKWFTSKKLLRRSILKVIKHLKYIYKSQAEGCLRGCRGWESVGDASWRPGEWKRLQERLSNRFAPYNLPNLYKFCITLFIGNAKPPLASSSIK